jgi:hypothetical protein
LSPAEGNTYAAKVWDLSPVHHDVASATWDLARACAQQDKRHQSELVDAIFEMQQAQAAAMSAVVTLEQQLEQQSDAAVTHQQHKAEMRALQADTAQDLESALEFERQKIREEAAEEARASTVSLQGQLRTANERIVDMAATIDGLKEQTPTKKNSSSAADSFAGAGVSLCLGGSTQGS